MTERRGLQLLFGPVDGDPVASRRLAGRLDLLVAVGLWFSSLVLSAVFVVLAALANGESLAPKPASEPAADGPVANEAAADGAVADGAVEASSVMDDLGVLMLLQLLSYALLLPLALRLHRAGRFDGLAAAIRSIGYYVLFLVVWFPVAFGLVPWLLEQAGVAPDQQDHLVWFADQPFSLRLVGALSLVVVVGPIFEEVLFRGYLWRGIDQLIGRRAALVITALLFGLVHQGAFSYVFVPLVLFGLFLAWLRERTDSLLAPTVVHMVHNGWTVAVMLAAGPAATEASGG